MPSNELSLRSGVYCGIAAAGLNDLALKIGDLGAMNKAALSQEAFLAIDWLMGMVHAFV